MDVSVPGWGILRAVGDDGQDPGGLRPPDHTVEELLGCRVYPLRILDDHQDRLSLGKREELRNQRLHGPLFVGLRAELQIWIALARRDRQQGGK